MSQISIDVTPEEQEKLEILAARNGKSIRDYVLERALGENTGKNGAAALAELEVFLDERIRGAKSGLISKRTVESIFEDACRERNAG